MRANIPDDSVEKSASFNSAKSKAKEYTNDPDKLNDLLDKAQKKADSKKGPLSEVLVSLMAFFRLLRAYATGKYRDIPWQSLTLIIASVIYFVMPFDLIPDFIMGAGFLDDAALLGWTIKSVKTDIDHFIEWEKT